MKNVVITLALVLGIGGALLAASEPAQAINVFKNCTDGVVCQEANKTSNPNNFIQDIVNLLLFLVGAVSVIMIIVGGFRYVLSAGDSSQTTQAKNTILYAVVGLIISLLAFAIVNFVVNWF